MPNGALFGKKEKLKKIYKRPKTNHKRKTSQTE